MTKKPEPTSGTPLVEQEDTDIVFYVGLLALVAIFSFIIYLAAFNAFVLFKCVQ